MSPPAHGQACRLPASFAQERMWFLDRLHGGSAFYNMPVLLQLPGRVYRAVLERSLAALTERHEGLRTGFGVAKGMVFQQIEETCQPSLSWIDLRRFPPRERDRRAAELMAAESARPFDLAQAPLLRATLYRLGPKQDQLLLVMHHIISDGWSVEILLRELSELYAAFDAGQPSPLLPLPIQYADWAAWQRNRFAGDALDEAIATWCDRLAGAPHSLELPADHARPPVPSFRGAIAHFAIPADLATGLNLLARQAGCTLFAILLAAFAILLGRHAGQTDIVIGTPMTNRSRREIEGVLGLFINTLPLRINLAGTPDVRALLARVQRTVLDTQANSEVPLERLIEAVNPPRSLDRHPIFQTLFSFYVSHERRSSDGTAALRPASGTPPPSTGTAKFDLSLLLTETAGGLGGAWEYATDLFDQDRVERLSGHYLAILSAFVAAPDAPVDGIELLTSRERRKLIGYESGPQRRRRSPLDAIHRRIAEQALSTPDAVAVEAGETRLTYAALMDRTELLARRLARQGVGPQSRVGVLVGRNADMVVSVLAILRRGAAYVPLDPAHPRDRLAFLARDAAIEIAVTQDRFAGRLPPGVAAVPVSTADDASGAPDPDVLDEQVAYILYTSGSIGLPKGVAVPHRAVAAFLDWAAVTFDAAARARVLASTSLCFDLSVFELFLPLTTGGTVVIVENVLALASAEPLDVTLINTVPSAMRELLTIWRPHSSPRAINLAGEALPHDLVTRIAETMPGVAIANLYGPTEATIYSTWARVTSDATGVPPIGRPIDGTVVRVLDDHGRRVPVGVPGELYIGGQGVACGYVGRAAQTAERFVPDVFSRNQGARMYRSGDLVRWRADGALDYLGRIDHQVKLRGYRVEPGEIETALRRHRSVREAVVQLREDAPGDPCLVAYIATDDGAEIAFEAAFWSMLPDYMVPSRFVFLPALPRTVSGKLDKGALPAPVVKEAAGARAPISPREAVVAEVFAAAIGVTAFDPDADFFAAGGHSLLATRVMSQLSEIFGTALPLSALFEHPSPAALAALIETFDAAMPDAANRAPDEDDPCPLSSMQEGIWFYCRLRPGIALYNMPIVVGFDGPPDVDAVRGAIDDLVARHDALRLRFDSAHGEPFQFVDDSLRVPLGRTEPADNDLDGIRCAIEREVRRPFDLRRGPPVRATLIGAPGHERCLLLVMHHIVGDGRSTEILTTDFWKAYETLSRGGRPALPRRAVRYTDAVRRQREALTDAAIERHVAFFREALAGAPEMLALPTDRCRPSNPSFLGGMVPFRVSATTAARAAAVAASRGITLHTLYLASLALLLHRLTGWPDVVIGVPVANRGRPEWANVVGLFINSLPLRIDGRDAVTFADLLARANQGAAYAHQEMPFDRLVRHLVGGRSLACHPIFQVMFGYHEVKGELAGFADATTGTAKFDLAINLTAADNGAFGVFEYASDLFNRDSISRVARYFEQLLDAVAAEPTATLDGLAPMDAPLRAWCEAGRVHAARAVTDVAAASSHADGTVVPRGEMEQRIAEIWSEVLGHSDFGVHDVFFDVGGHSLAAMIVIARIGELGYEIGFEAMFATPTIAALAKIAEASPSDAADEIPAVDRSVSLPLSFAQERLWFLDQLNPGLSVYNIPVVIQLRGAVDRFALQRALERLGDRHETLRARFCPGAAGPEQRIDPVLSIPLAFSDLSSLGATARDREAARLQARIVRRPFDLEQGPLLRAHLVQLAPDDHALLLCIHHIAADARSIDILRRDLAVLYETERTGVPETLPVLTAQYAEFTAWQRRRLSGERMAAEIAWWRERLDGAPDLLALPTDRPRPKEQDYRGRQIPFKLDIETSHAIRRLAREEQATPFMVSLAAYAAMLGQWSDTKDVVVGTPAIGRPRREFEQSIGFFSNTLPIRLDLTAASSFRALVRQTRDAVVEALAHQDIPFEMMVQELRPQRSLAYNPVFQALLAWQHSDNAIDSTDVRNERAGMASDLSAANDDGATLWGTSKFDVTLFLVEGEAFRGALETRADLFDVQSIQQFGTHLRAFVAAATAAPDRSCGELAAATAADLAAVAAWNGNQLHFADADAVCDDLIARRARDNPWAVAVTDGITEMTYGALWQQASAIAARLRALGVEPSSRVAVVAEPSAQLVAAILGVWACGAACMPLDPAYPRERLDYMLADGRARCVVGGLDSGALAPGLPAVDWDNPGVADDVTWKPSLGERDPDHIAYVVYTSGSTGHPKGVAMAHRALANLVLWQSAGSRGAPRRTLQFASPSFDVFFQELVLTLGTGGMLIVASRAQRLDAVQLLALCRDREVERLFLPYVALREFAEAGVTADPLPCLREVITAGEQVQVTRAIRSWFAANRGCNLINQYGPSETHVVTEERLGPDPEVWPDLPPIGSPIANVRCRILDAALRPVPVGAPGELYVGGVCLARAYLDRPDLTAERFLPDPFSAGERLYRTGDRARWLPDGRIAFIGRNDHQVKIRGYRVEPAEVEIALAAQEGVAQAVVLADEDNDGQRRLVAYVLPDRPGVDSAALREGVRVQLADWMVPSRIVIVDRFARTPSGKIDRRALGAAQVRLGTPVLPGEGVAGIVARVWCDVLGLEQVGADEDFFRLGGHSLSAAKVAARLREQLRGDCPVRLVFEHPTVAGLATAIGVDTAPRTSIRAIPRDGGPLPTSYAQKRMWFLDSLAPGNPSYNLASVVSFPPMADREAIQDAVQALVRRHEALRTVFQVIDGEPMQIIAPAARVPIETIDLSFVRATDLAAESNALIADEAGRAFDLASGPLFRATIADFGTGGVMLLLTMHHIVSDAWSLRVIERDLRALYEAFVEGTRLALPPRPMQYADFAVWQRAVLTDEEQERLLAWWRDAIGDAPRRLQLGFSRRQISARRVGRQMTVIDAKTVAALNRQASEQRATLFMAVLAAYCTLLRAYTDSDDFLVGVPIGAREDVALEDTVGLFVNTLVLRADMLGDPTFRDLLARVRERAVGAYGHAALPFERLVEALQPERDPEVNPLVQVAFGLHRNGEIAFGFGPPSEGVPSSGGNGNAQFDLSLILFEKDGKLSGLFEYRRDVLSDEMVAGMARHFERIVDLAATEPDVPMSRWSLLDERSLRKLLVEWGPGEPIEATADLTTIVAAHAARDPGKCAVEAPDGTLDYRTLNGRANWLANRIRAAGLTPEARIGVCLGNSAHHPVALLAILKAGAVYVPLDPALPPARLRYLTEASGVQIAIAPRAGRERFAAAGIPVCCVEDLAYDSSAPPPPDEVDPLKLAYIVYTSGSSGTPKGVMISRIGLRALIAAQTRTLALSPRDRVLKFATPSFDAAIFEMTTALSAGATLCLESEDKLLPGPDLPSLLRARRATMVTITPSSLAMVPVERCPDLRLLFVAGEVCSAELASFWAPGRRMINGYGPTEATVWASWSDVRPDGSAPPIGRPIPNTVLRIVDRTLQLAPPGIPGELCIAGSTLARGYLDRPGPTAAVFVPDPYGQPGGRMYRTGDLARWRDDGNVEYLGRIDDQVKIRGVRIEPGEIEQAIMAQPGVAYAVAVAREIRRDELVLIAYAVPEHGVLLDPAAMLAALRRLLPRHALPAHLLVCDELPKTPSGKLDRKALPIPSVAAKEVERAPAGSCVEAVCAICSDILKVPVGPSDNFFALGGHSLLLMLVVSRLREQLGIDVSPRLMFEVETLNEFCEGLTPGLAPVSGIPRLLRIFAASKETAGVSLAQAVSAN
jgi:amino acid adenylation domain-containing protein